MKTAVVITLIVAGAVLVAIPPLSDAWGAYLMTRVMEHRNGGEVTMGGRLGDWYRFGCWLLGAAMIGVGEDVLLQPALFVTFTA